LVCETGFWPTQNIKIWDVDTETVVAEVKSVGFNVSIVQWSASAL